MEEKTKFKVEVESTSSFERRLQAAYVAMVESGNPVFTIEEGSGIVLVRDGTPEAQERKSNPGRTLRQQMFAGDEQIYLICLS